MEVDPEVSPAATRFEGRATADKTLLERWKEFIREVGMLEEGKFGKLESRD